MPWNRCILHIDGDGFFASVEQALNPYLRGKPVITGQERGVITSASKEAKILGISRGVTPWDAKKICPDLIFLPGNYVAYEEYSRKLVKIVSNYVWPVEHYSIDEIFADMTGFDRCHRRNYEELGKLIKESVQNELGITFSVGIASTKVLAKVASRWQKPNGYTVIAPCEEKTYLQNWPVEKLWGIGPRLADKLAHLGITTAGELAQLSVFEIKKYFTKPTQELWAELNGEPRWKVLSGPGPIPKSLTRTRTFHSPTESRDIIEQELLLNLETALWKLRKYNLNTTRVAIMLKDNSFQTYWLDTPLPRASAFEAELLPHIDMLFSLLWRPNKKWRASGVCLFNLTPAHFVQQSLFESSFTLERRENIACAADALRNKYGYPVIRSARMRLSKKDRLGVTHETPVTEGGLGGTMRLKFL